jgi:serine/threonine protein kinase
LQNVLIGGEFEVKLIDFGLTRVGESGRAASDSRYEGTPFYMSPEIFKGGEYSYEVDMWAVGVML